MLNLSNIMLGSEDSKNLADFYGKILGAQIPIGATKTTAGSVSKRATGAWPLAHTAT